MILGIVGGERSGGSVRQMESFEFFTMGVPVRLSDRSLHKEGQKKFVKNCPQWGLKPGPPDHEANALPNELGVRSVGQEISDVISEVSMNIITL